MTSSSVAESTVPPIRRTIALLTDLWPSHSEPSSGPFVLGEVAALNDRFRHVVLVPRLLLGRLHRQVWADGVQGFQEGWTAPPAPSCLLRYPMLRVPKRGEVGARALGARRALARASERPALVHGHFLLGAGSAAVSLATRLGVPSVVTVHGTDFRWLFAGGIQERHRVAMRTTCMVADRLIAVSQPIAEGLVELGIAPSRVATIPMGVDQTLFRPADRTRLRRELGIEGAARLVLFVGRATEEKGFGVLDEALAQLHGVTCVAAGSGPLTSSRIRSLGVLAPQELARWVGAADVVCLPSLAEGTPVSVSEALAAGRPVVATDVGGMPQQIVPEINGLLVAPRDSHALAEALEQALMRDWSEAAIRATSEPFWWSTVGMRVGGIYDGLLGEIKR